MPTVLASIFAAVAAFLRTHPVATSAAGAGSGIFAWLVAQGENLALIFRVVGGFFGCLLTILCFLFTLPRAVRFVRNWRRKGFAKADAGEPPFPPPSAS